MSDIDDFLRRAAQQRARGQRPAIEIVEPIEPIEAEIIDAEPADVSAHVKSYMDTGKFDRRADQMDRRAGLADDRREARIHAKFDHEIGTLRQSDATLELVDEPVSDVSLLDVLRSPASIRQAIIMSEILQPPRDLW